MIRISLLLLFGFVSINQEIYSQVPKPTSTSEIYSDLQRLNTVGSALYVAAHPDDENTRLISYLSNIKHIKTTYLSLTRGDGGQNMIGTHIQEDLGIVRTQELLAARRIDNGNQMFTRANDFGYSKTSEETIEFWDKDKILADVVWAIRKTRPDVIINRFSEDDERTHGHHRASAILSLQAYELAGDPTAFPEQLEYVEPWTPKKIYYNTSWWRYRSREAFEKVDKSDMVTVDIGSYQALRGESMAEIAAKSRSMHKSQGFGSSGARGKNLEYLVPKKNTATGGEMFTGINTDWSRLEGGEEIGQVIDEIISNYDLSHPEKSVPQLLEVRSMIKNINSTYWKEFKLNQVNQIIKDCLGLYLGAFTDKTFYTPGDSIHINYEVTKRNNFNNVSLENIASSGIDYIQDKSIELETNISQENTVNLKIPEAASFSNPYWLEEKGSMGMYKVKDQKLIGSPESEPALHMTFSIKIGNQVVEYSQAVMMKETQRVAGEVRTPIAIVPEIVSLPNQDLMLFNNGKKDELTLTFRSYVPQYEGKVKVNLPNKKWSVDKNSFTLNIPEIGGEQKITLTVTPPKEASEMELSLEIDSDGSTETLKTLSIIDYDHLPQQVKVKETSIRLVNLLLETRGENIGYIMGAGDKVPEAIEKLGYSVDMLSDADITPNNLSTYDAIVIGIRAYNTVDRMKIYQPILFDYVKQGGTMIVQYNTTWGLEMDNLGPYSIEFSRERVTEEDAEVTVLAPDHPVMNFPNEIRPADFDNWVQERGLYFATNWDEKYTPILSAHDKGEPARKGGMLITEYGEGHYIFSGYSWFRELPAGVPGAYRIFANMLSIGHAE